MLRGLAAGDGLGEIDFFFALEVSLGDVFFADELRIAGGDVHGDVVHQFLEVVGAGDEIALAVDFDQHADLASGVNVAGDGAFAGDARVAFLAATETPRLRSTTTACSMSPLASVRAFLQSIMGAPVFSRSSFTCAAEIFTVDVLMISSFSFLSLIFRLGMRTPGAGNQRLETAFTKFDPRRTTPRGSDSFVAA